MKQEYLFSEVTDAENVKSLNVLSEAKAKSELDLNVTVDNLPGNSLFIVAIDSGKNNEDVAKILSRIDSKIRESFSPVVLSNESSSYFNKTLFPIVNDFERRLRKLLYLTASINSDDKAASNINGLEEKDLGQLFELLFTDIEFVKNAKKTITNPGGQFSKAEALKLIESLEENTVWNQLLGENLVPTLECNYLKIKQYRNDVMHAHNIDYNTFIDARSLYKKVNDEIDVAIDGITTNRNSVMPEFNEAFGSMISAFDQLKNTSPTVIDNLTKIASILASGCSVNSPSFADAWKDSLKNLYGDVSDSHKKNVDDKDENGDEDNDKA